MLIYQNFLFSVFEVSVFVSVDFISIRNSWAKLAYVTLFSLLAACVGVPQQELTTYREAYLEAQRAGELLYDELALAVVRAGGGPAKNNCVRTTATPKCFDPYQALDDGAPADIPAIRARRLALKSVETYNLAIIDLLEGGRGELASSRILELRNTASDLLKLASVTAGPLPALVGGQSAALLAALVKRLDSIAARQQARASLIENAPVIDEMIKLLIEDTRDMYRLYFISQFKYSQDLEIAGGRKNKAALDARAKIGPYHDQLTAYVKLLVQTNESFAQLLTALESGSGSPDDLRAAIRESIEIKKAAEDFWAEVRKAK